MRQPRRHSTTRGFARTSGLLQTRIAKASETRGFAVSRLLTHWSEIVGQDIAAMAHPVKVGYGRKGFGATLTVLTTGAQAPMLEMQKERIRERVNACYGYRAIERVAITQTAPTGFAEGRATFQHAPKQPPEPPRDPEIRQAAASVAEGVADDDLRAALERLGAQVLSKNNHR